MISSLKNPKNIPKYLKKFFYGIKSLFDTFIKNVNLFFLFWKESKSD